jgi:hypothetical protein
MGINKSENSRLHWFPNELNGTGRHRFLALNQATVKLSKRSRNALLTRASNPTIFRELFRDSTKLIENLLAIRNVGKQSALELKAWWCQLEPQEKSVLLGEEGESDAEIANENKLVALDEELKGKANRVAQQLAQTLDTLSVRSRNGLKRYAPSHKELLWNLVLNDNLEQDLYGVRNLGRRSVIEICQWVEKTRLGVPEQTVDSNSGAIDGRWTRFSPFTIQSLRVVLEEVQLTSSLPFDQTINTPLSLRNLQLGHFLDALLLKHRTNQSILLVRLDPFFARIDDWLNHSAVPNLKAIRWKGIWMECLEMFPPVTQSFKLNVEGIDHSPAIRNHLIWWHIQFNGAKLAQMGESFGVSRERIRQLHLAFCQRVDLAYVSDEALADLFIEQSGQIWQYNGEWSLLGATDTLLWKGLAVFQGQPHLARVWGGERIREQLVAKLNVQIQETGMLEELVLMQKVVDFFGSWVEPRAVLEWVKGDLKKGMRTNDLICEQVFKVLNSSERALSLEEIQAKITERPTLQTIRRQLLRLTKTRQLITIGKRGFYMRPIRGFGGSCFQYDDAARMYFEQSHRVYASVEELLQYYITLTGLETSLHSFHTSLQIQACNPRTDLVVLPFYHIGLREKTVEMRRLATKLNTQVITANLNQFKSPFPKPGSAAYELLIDRFARQLQQDQQFIAMALTHRFWVQDRAEQG